MEHIENFNKLKSWLQIYEPFDYLNLITSPYRKVVAKKDIPDNTIIFCILDDKLIDNRFFKNLNKYNEYKDRIKSTNSLLALCLIDKMKDVFWKPYIDILPKNLNDMWYYISPEVKELIKNSSLANEIEQFKSSRFEEDINVLKEYFPVFNSNEFVQKWFFAKLLVNSRVFGYTRHNESMSGLVPMADMLNHDINPNCNWYYDDNMNGFCMKTNRKIYKDEELLDSYGSKESTRFYLLYGFIPNNLININDVSININDIIVNINTNIDTLIQNFKGDKTALFDVLIDKLKKLPTKRQLLSANCDNNIIILIGHEKNIIKKLLIQLKNNKK